jgi:uncharacterized protein YaiL (DUF2058 family)
MSLSLRDQLLKAGLVNQKQAKQVSKEKQKQQRLAHKGQAERMTPSSAWPRKPWPRRSSATRS